MLKMLKYVLLATLVSCIPILIAFRFANVTEVKFILLILVPPLIWHIYVVKLNIL